jgi:hypothetical protein
MSSRRRMNVLIQLFRPREAGRLGDREANRLGGLEVDDQLIFCRRLDRQVAGLFAAKDAVHVGRASAGEVGVIGRIAHHAPCGYRVPPCVDRREGDAEARARPAICDERRCPDLAIPSARRLRRARRFRWHIKLDASNTQDRIAADLAAKEIEAESQRGRKRPRSSSPSRADGTPPSSAPCSDHHGICRRPADQEGHADLQALN